MQYRVNLKAGIPLRQTVEGKTFVLVSTGAASELDLKIEIQGFAAEELRGIKRGFKLRSPGFTSCMLTSAVDCTIEIVTSAADLSINYQDGATVNANIINLPLAVVPDRGAPANPVYVAGITYADAPAVTLQDNAAASVFSAGEALVAANPARRGLRITNLGPDPVALGFTGITWAKRCIVLSAGDTWIEDRAANLAWAAVCDTAKTASVTVQEVIS